MMPMSPLMGSGWLLLLVLLAAGVLIPVLVAMNGTRKAPPTAEDELRMRYARGELELDTLVTRVIPLEETEEAFEAMQRGETLRSVIRLS